MEICGRNLQNLRELLYGGNLREKSAKSAGEICKICGSYSTAEICGRNLQNLRELLYGGFCGNLREKICGNLRELLYGGFYGNLREKSVEICGSYSTAGSTEICGRNLQNLRELLYGGNLREKICGNLRELLYGGFCGNLQEILCVGYTLQGICGKHYPDEV
ncbi:MAG: hypothetical protein IPH12_14450 [Saprospirales bacterium]|nr:hypothetical protein [Saprospirales bacterium]